MNYISMIEHKHSYLFFIQYIYIHIQYIYIHYIYFLLFRYKKNLNIQLELLHAKDYSYLLTYIILFVNYYRSIKRMVR